MTTLSAFNTMLRSFLEELRDVYPEEKSVAVFLGGFDALVAASARVPLDMFVTALSPHADALMAKDDSLFAKVDLGGIDLGKMWAQPDVSDNTRAAIWQYLHTLFLLGTTVSSVPQELLESIETVAANCAENMQAGNMDFSAMSKMLMGGLGGLGGGMGGGLGGMGGLGALLGGLGGAADDDASASPPPALPAAPRRHHKK